METEASQPIEKKPKKANTSIANATSQEVTQVSSVEGLLSLAINKDLDIDKLERLIEMKERNDREAARRLFVQALANFQSECPEIIKTQSGYEDRYKFASIGNMDKIIKPILHKNGLTKDWKFEHFKLDDNKTPMIRVTCIISHIGGWSEKTSMEAEHDASGSKNAIQARGSSIKYLERYTLEAALGLTTVNPDNDGKGSKGDSKLPELKDSQIGAIITRIHKGEMTWEQLDTKCIYTPEQRKTIEEGLEKIKSGK